MRLGTAPIGPVLAVEGELFETRFQLCDLGYVDSARQTYETGPGAAFDLRITGHGLQVLGRWPRFEALLSAATRAEVVDRLAEFDPT